MGDETLSQQILRQNAAILDEMLGHRFIEDIKSDALPAPIFHRYLQYEGAFVETAIAIFGYAVAKAETISDQRWLISVLQALANEQVSYFEQTFADLGIDRTTFDATLEDVVAFQEGMLEIAREGGFRDIVVAMFAAEWMYWTWCRQAAEFPISDPFLKRWIELHTDAAFAAQALWLKSRLDELGTALSAPERQRLSETFAVVTRLEINFHRAPYGPTPLVG